MNLWSRPSPPIPAHKCAYELRGVTITKWAQATNDTHVLYVCPCGNTQVEAMLGEWTMEQLKGSQP